MNPIDSIPGPRIDHVRELIRWFDRWLRGTQNGIDREPPIVLFVRRSTPPAPDLDAFRGEWRYEAEWPLGTRPPPRPRARQATAARVRRRSPCAATSASWGTSAAPTTRPTGSRSTSGPTRSTRSSTTGRWPDELEILGNAGRRADLPLEPACRLRRRAPHRGAPRRHVGAREPRHPEPDPSRLAHRPRAARAGRRLHGADRARRDVVGLHGGKPHPPRARRCRLARRLAAPGRVGAHGRAGGARGSCSPRSPAPRRSPSRPTSCTSPAPVEGGTEGSTWRIEHDVYGRETRVVVGAGVVGRPRRRVAACSARTASAPASRPRHPAAPGSSR